MYLSTHADSSDTLDTTDTNTVDDFQSVARESFDAAESLSAFLSSKVHSPPPSFSRASTVDPVPQAPTRVHHTRHASATQQVKLMFLRDQTTTPSILYKLECLDCQRSNFTNVQGLVNHIRIKHERNVPSHDECIQMCAKVVPEEDRAWIMENGIEISQTSASLRRLFEMAVGTGEGIFSSQALSDGGDKSTSMEHPQPPPYDLDAAAHLLRTLGHHVDTPELAPFLGRAPKQRLIHVHDTDELIDIESPSSEIQHAVSPSWQMPYKPRSSATLLHDEYGQDASSQLMDQMQTSISDRSVPLGLDDSIDRGTRFHITARLVVTDWSMRISESMFDSTYD